MNNVNDLISYVLSSPNRIKILCYLKDTKLTNDEISKKCCISSSYSWKLLQGLMKKGIVERNEVSRNQLYFLSDLGYLVLYKMEER